jgi:hypothetical protein
VGKRSRELDTPRKTGKIRICTTLLATEGEMGSTIKKVQAMNLPVVESVRVYAGGKRKCGWAFVVDGWTYEDIKEFIGPASFPKAVNMFYPLVVRHEAYLKAQEKNKAMLLALEKDSVWTPPSINKVIGAEVSLEGYDFDGLKKFDEYQLGYDGWPK